MSTFEQPRQNTNQASYGFEGLAPADVEKVFAHNLRVMAEEVEDSVAYKRADASNTRLEEIYPTAVQETREMIARDQSIWE